MPEVTCKYQTVLEIILPSEKPVEKPFTDYAKGLMNKNISDCYAQLGNTYKSERAANLSKSKTYDQNAVIFWKSSEVRCKFLSRSPESIEFLDRKFSNSIR